MKKEHPFAWKIVNNYQSFIIFLVAECLAFVGFGLANVNTIFRFLGFVVAIVLLAYALLFSPKTERNNFIVFALPLLIYSILMCLSVFGGAYFDAFDNISIFVGLPSFLFLGYAVKNIKNVNIDIFFIVIGVSLTLLLLISGIYSLTRYGFFHPLIYKNMFYYFEGELFNVSREMKFFIGFSFPEVSLKYVGLFATLLTGFLGAIFFINPKKDYKKFFIYLAVGLVGLFTNLFITNVFALIITAFTFVIIALYRFLPKNKKITKICLLVTYVLVGLVSLFALSFIINAAAGDLAFIKENEFLSKLYITSSFTKPWHDAIFLMTRPEGIFGIANYVTENGVYSMYLFNAKYGVSIDFPINSGSYIFDAAMEGGLFAFLLIILFTVLAIISTVRYISKSNDEKYRKAILIGVLLSSVLYANLFYDSMPLIHNDATYYSFARTMPMLLILFFVGYSFYPFFKVKDIALEQKVIDEEYQKDLTTESEDKEDEEDE